MREQERYEKGAKQVGTVYRNIVRRIAKTSFAPLKYIYIVEVKSFLLEHTVERHFECHKIFQRSLDSDTHSTRDSSITSNPPFSF